MFVRVKSTPNSPRRSVQIVESRRVGGKVAQAVVRYVGVAADEVELEGLKRLAEAMRLRLEAERSEQTPLFAPEEMARPTGYTARHAKAIKPPCEVRLSDIVEETRVVEGIHDIFSILWRELGFTQILENPSQAKILQDCVLARIAQPSSKHRTAALLERQFGISIPLDRIYRMLDALHPRTEAAQELVFTATRSLFKERVDVVFFDVTTLYFESAEVDDLRDFGYSKDQQFQTTQVVLALATTENGLPVGYKVFPGSTGEVKTLLACVETWKQRLDIGRIVLVADRAMMSKANLEELETNKIEYIVGAKLRQLPKLQRETVLDLTAFQASTVEEEPIRVAEFSFMEGRRLIVSHSERRAEKDRSDRERMIEKVKKRLARKARSETANAEAKGPKKPSKAVKQFVGNRGYARFLELQGETTVSLDEAKIAQEARWDGLHGIITNSKTLSPSDLLSRYRQLWCIEAAFRVSKHDLAMRPIYHWKPKRIEAHILICYLAYALLRHAQHRVKLQQQPMSVEQLRNELLGVQASILQDKTTKARYRLPSPLTQAAQAIYQAFYLKRTSTPTPIHIAKGM
jgi:transposase